MRGPPAARPSPTRAESVEHRRDAIQHRVTFGDRPRIDVPPSDRDSQRRACLAVRPRRRREPRDAIAAAAGIAFANVERDGRKRAAELLAEIAVALPNARNDRAKSLDREDRHLEDIKRGGAGGRFFLHARTQRKKRDSASRVARKVLALARFFRARACKKNRPPAGLAASPSAEDI